MERKKVIMSETICLSIMATHQKVNKTGWANYVEVINEIKIETVVVN